jgi:hypothetical protein
MPSPILGDAIPFVQDAQEDHSDSDPRQAGYSTPHLAPQPVSSPRPCALLHAALPILTMGYSKDSDNMSQHSHVRLCEFFFAEISESVVKNDKAQRAFMALRLRAIWNIQCACKG